VSGRAAFAGLVAAALAALLPAGCADDCEKACGKIDFCRQLLTMDVYGCVDACGDDDAEVVTACAHCLDLSGCNEIRGGACGEPCGSLER
jgi:hypothetical protein